MNVPHGWKLVPVEPTPAMTAAYAVAAEELTKRHLLSGSYPATWQPTEAGYAAMLAAAPTSPVQQDDEALEVLRRIISTWESPWPPGADPMAHVLAEARSLLTKRGAA